MPYPPGVPPLLEPIISLANTIALAKADADFFRSLFNRPQYILMDSSGLKVLDWDTIGAWQFVNDWRISDYPQEEGAFESYNKVQNPFTIRVRVVRSGSPQKKQDFITLLEAASATTALYDFVTPEKVYRSVNIEKYEYAKTAVSGVGMLNVDIVLREVRVTATVEFSNTRSPSGANTSTQGSVQPQTVPQSQAISILDAQAGP